MQINAKVDGYIIIRDALTKEVIVSKKNAIHHGNMSEFLALGLVNTGGYISKMVFGNGAATVSGTDVITYFSPNVDGQGAELYHQTYEKIVDQSNVDNTDPDNNNITVEHSQNATFSDVVITCTLNYNEPSGQEAFGTTTTLSGEYVFNEIGLIGVNSTGTEKLLTHVIFNPVQKALNISIEIVYRIRITTM